MKANLGTIRAVQIDLARQIETLPEVFRFFDISREAGMNTVVLYLEDRIKTEAYPYPSEVDTYSPKQITEMVEYAESLGLELIPVVSNLGHTERFLRHKELEGLAERRGGIAGRFSGNGHATYNTSCPLLPQARDFYDRYITEVSRLFPSKYFNVGLDESFDMGYCELCRGTKEAQLFTEHIRHTHTLLSGLGKTMMMWDDMFEQYPDALMDIPRDIVMCSWHYDFTDRFPAARFSHCRREDSFALYDRLGFKYLACPYPDISNIESLTAYARRYNPEGMFLTVWELSCQQLLIMHPLVIYAGTLWTDERELLPAERILMAAERVTGSKPLAEAAAHALSESFEFTGSGPMSGNDLTRHIEMPDGKAMLRTLSFTFLEKSLEALEEDSDGYRDAYLIRLKRFCLAHRINGLALRLMEYRTGDKSVDLQSVIEGLEQCKTQAKDFCKLHETLWQKRRPGFPAYSLDKQNKAFTEELDILTAAAQSAVPGEIGRLDVRFFLPDQTVLPKTRITLHFTDGSKQEIAHAIFKSHDIAKAYITHTFAITSGKTPEAVSFSVTGYGGTGIAHVDAVAGGSRFIPKRTGDVSGNVQNQDYILDDDKRAAFIGTPDMRYAYLNVSASEAENKLTVWFQQFQKSFTQ